MIELKLLQATFKGTRAEWLEVIGHLTIGWGPDRRIATTILNGLDRQKKVYFKIYYPDLAESLDEYDDSNVVYNLRFKAGSVSRICEVLIEIEQEEYAQIVEAWRASAMWLTEAWSYPAGKESVE